MISKIIFTQYESLLIVVFSPVMLKNSDQRHMMKIVAFFNYLSFSWVIQRVALRLSF